MLLINRRLATGLLLVPIGGIRFAGAAPDATAHITFILINDIYLMADELMPDGQRRAIYQALKDQPSSAFNADVGTELPPAIELRPVPDEVAARVPQTRDYRYVVANGRVLLVGTSRIVVGIFVDANAPVSEGR